MKAKSENINKKYEPVEIDGSGVTLNFSKTVQGGATTVTANIKKGEEGVGLISYSSKDNYIISQLKPLDDNMKANILKIFGTIGKCMNDILTEK